MKTKRVKKPRAAKKLAIVIERLEKKVGDAHAAIGSCKRIYCIPSM